MECSLNTTEFAPKSRAFSAGILAIPAEPLAERPKLTLSEALGLYDALKTVENVLHGMSSWGCFAKDENEFNPAGVEIDDLRLRICRRLERLIDEVRAIKPDNSGDDWFKTAFLIRHDAENDPKIARQVKAAIYDPLS